MTDGKDVGMGKDEEGGLPNRKRVDGTPVTDEGGEALQNADKPSAMIRITQTLEGPVEDPYVSSNRRSLPRPGVALLDRTPEVLRKHGACADLGPGVLDPDAFAVDDAADDPQRAAAAKAICAACPLRQRCLDYAMDNEPYGIWGGLDARERLNRRGSPLAPHEERRELQRLLDAFARGATAGQVAEDWQVTRRCVERWRRDLRAAA